MWQKVAKFKGAEYFRKALYYNKPTHCMEGTREKEKNRDTISFLFSIKQVGLH